MISTTNFSWSRLFPFLLWRGLFTRANLRADLLAGLTGAIIVLPQGVAFATIAGMPPEYGLYAAMVPAIVGALFGSSWHLVSGPTTAISIVVFGAISPMAEPGGAQYISLVLTLTFMVGVLQLIMGIARLGVLVNFISHTVVIGFTAGAAILIASSQFKNFLGISIAQGSSFYQTIYATLTEISDIQPWVLAVGVVTLASGILAKKFIPKFPYMIVAMLAGSLVAFAMNMMFGVDVTHIRTLGSLPGKLQPLSMPDFSPTTLQQLSHSALAIAILALTEAVSISRAIAVRSHQRIDGNQEFIGQGLSNLAGSFFSGYASSGSFNRSGLNYEAGAKTPVASILASFFLAGILLLVAPFAAYLPIAAMASILFLVAWGLIDFKHIKIIIKTSRAETAVLVTTFISTLFLNLEFAIYVGVILSLALYLKRTSRPRIVVRVPDPKSEKRALVTDPHLPECPQLKIIRIDGSAFFGAVNYIQETLQNIGEGASPQKHVLVIAKSINFADIAGTEMLVQEATRRRVIGGGLYFYQLKDQVRKMLEKSGYMATVRPENIFRSKADAIQSIFAKLDHDICKRCDKRIFLECKQIPLEITPPNPHA
ncbi:MAG: SulP family inorganic anion transporter [Gammaproteobacteria bacterium]|nr:SulP family inorganic anion transporter [Gammaproteobacteria bacterium]